MALRRFVSGLRASTAAPIALLCHSYGSVVCAKAAPGLPVSDVAVFGSPGLSAPDARIFTTGPCGHSAYFSPGTASLRNLTLIALGRTAEVSRG